jgi:hypothetical protein
MAHDVFISYAHEDKLTADAVCAKLEEKQVRCWIAPRDVRPGETWPAAVANAIDGSKVMVLVFSAHTNLSNQIPNEVTRAVDRGLVLVPLRIEDVLPGLDLSLFLTRPHWLDAVTPPLEKHLEELCRAVASFLEDSGPEDLEEPEEPNPEPELTPEQEPEPHAAQNGPVLPGAPSQETVTLSETQQRAVAEWVRPGALFEESLAITGRTIMAPMRSSVASVPNVGVVLGVLGMVLIALYSWIILPLIFVWLWVQSRIHKEELAHASAQRMTGTFGLSVYRGKDNGIRGARMNLPQGTLHLNAQQAIQMGHAVDLEAIGQAGFAGSVVLFNLLGPNHLIAAYDRSGRLLCGGA